MSPEERAQAVLTCGFEEDLRLWWQEKIAHAIREAVDAEREACAKVADEWADTPVVSSRSLGRRIAAVIRARGEGGK